MRALFGGGQFLDLMTEVRLVPVPPRGVGKDGAAIVFPALDFDLRQAAVWRRPADRMVQAVAKMSTHVALPSW